MNDIIQKNRTRKLQEKIKGVVQIPESLRGNAQFKISNRFGLYLSFYSNTKAIGKPDLSDVSFRLFFVTVDDHGNFIGDNVRIGIIGSGDITPIPSIDAVSHYSNIVQKINVWLKENESYLHASITN